MFSVSTEFGTWFPIRSERTSRLVLQPKMRFFARLRHLFTQNLVFIPGIPVIVVDQTLVRHYWTIRIPEEPAPVQDAAGRGTEDTTSK